MTDELALVRTVAAALATAHTESEVADAVLTAVADHLGAATASLWLLTADETEMLLAYERNAEADAVARFARIPMGADLPGPQVARSREPVFIASRDERDTTWPGLVGTPSPSEAIVVLPLVGGNNTLGVVAFGFAEIHTFSDEDRLTLMAVADQCAVALDRAKLFQALRADSDANDLLARVSASGGGTDWQAAAQRIVDICVDALVDSSAIYLLEGTMVRRVAAASRTYPDVVAGLIDRFPFSISAASPIASAIRSGEKGRIPPGRPGRDRPGPPSPEYRRRVRDIEVGDGWAFPLKDGRGRCFGAIWFAVLPRDGQIPQATVELFEHIATRAAAVLRSAEEFSQHREALDAIHAVLLPGDIPHIEGFDVAACYQPVASGASVGGDWWDVVELPDGRIAFSIGDVAGHGTAPVGLMGQLRTAARSHLVTGRGPAATLSAMSALLDWTAPTAHATAAVLIMDPETNMVTSAVAGHPPPIILDPANDAQIVECPPAPPLGVRPNRAQYADHSVELPNGSTLVLYTDGLIEDRQRTLDDGLAQLLATLRETSGESLDQQCERAVAVLADAPEDDVCLLLARRIADASASIELAADNSAAQVARQFVRQHLTAWGCDDMVADASLITSELVTNAVFYAQSTSTLVLRRKASSLRIEVVDHDTAMPQIQEHSLTRVRGRGLQVVATLAQRWGVEPKPGGKTVWAELALAD